MELKKCTQKNVYPKELKSGTSKDIYIPMFAALFTVAKSGNNLCLSLDE